MSKSFLSEGTDLALVLENINIGFSGVQVLYDANFSLIKNEIHAIVGKNGAGKSTFMKVLSGVYTPDSGFVRFEGEQQNISKKAFNNSTNKKRKDRYKQVSMVYQDLSLVPSLTVLQNIFLGHHPYSNFGILNDKKAKKDAIKILAQVGLSHILLSATADSLSVGEAQLLEIAKAISTNPKVIIFDEPTASLSDIEISKLFETVNNLRSKGLSIVYITHYLEDVMTLCDRVTVLRNGNVISTTAVKDTSLSDIVSDMLGEAAEDIPHWHDDDNEHNNNFDEALLNVIEARTSRVGPISLSVHPGEIVGIAGLLGSGRTEILRMLYGLDQLRSGEIHIDGKNIEVKHPQSAKKYGMALVPEERRSQGLVLDFSIEENIAIPNLKNLCSYFFIDTEKKSVMANSMINNLLIQTTGKNQVTRFLSGGNQQKVVIAKFLASNPKILLLDDPTFGVDVHAKIEIMKIIYDYVKSGNAVLFVSSEFNEIANFCNRIYIVKKGKIVNQITNNIDEGELIKLVQ